MSWQLLLSRLVCSLRCVVADAERRASRIGSPSVRSLRRRWESDMLADLRGQVVSLSRVVRGPHNLQSPWHTTDDGYVDLRGLVVAREGMQVKYLSLARTDFSHARGRLTFFESELTDCRFDSAALAVQSAFNRSLQQCSFRSLTATELAFGPHVLRCDFTGATMRKAWSRPNSRFEHCSFDGADFGGARFADTTFIDCTFTGTRFSADTSFTRCRWVNTPLDFGPARVRSSSRDGEPIPDQWEGETEADLRWDPFISRYAAAAAAGQADDMPLEPEP